MKLYRIDVSLPMLVRAKSAKAAEEYIEENFWDTITDDYADFDITPRGVVDAKTVRKLGWAPDDCVHGNHLVDEKILNVTVEQALNEMGQTLGKKVKPRSESRISPLKRRRPGSTEGCPYDPNTEDEA